MSDTTAEAAPRLKAPGCSHQFENEPHCVRPVRNTYECDTCGATWKDVWSCGCDDECPTCGDDVEASDSVEIEGQACACEYLRR